MSAWSENLVPEPFSRGASGELVSVRITVAPRDLEDLLQCLAEITFPINPQIYHQAVVVGLTPEGRRESRAATLVKFPAYRGDLPEVRAALERAGLPAGTLVVQSMLDDIESAGGGRADVPWLVWRGPAN